MENFDSLASLLFDEIIDIIDSFEQSSIEADIVDGIVVIKSIKGDYIINKQYVNKEIWLSSPISGAKHFTFNNNNETWVDKNNINIIDLIKSELNFLTY